MESAGVGLCMKCGGAEVRGGRGGIGRGQEGEEGVGQTAPHVLRHLTFLAIKY